MAAVAQRDLEKRVVEVDRQALLVKLHENKAKHVADYEEAKAAYKQVLLAKIKDAFILAQTKLYERQDKLTKKIESLTDDQISEQNDFITLVESINIEMKVPRCYADEYDAAIAIAEHDVNPTLKLSYAEFTCFIRDQWDWKLGFDAVSTMYKSLTTDG